MTDFKMEHLSRVVPRLVGGGGSALPSNDDFFDASQELLEFELERLFSDFFPDEAWWPGEF